MVHGNNFVGESQAEDGGYDVYFEVDDQAGPEGEGGLAAFLRVFVFFSFESNRLVGDTYVALVDG